MSDVLWLRDRLYAAVLATPLLAACSGSPRPTTDPPQDPPPADAAIAAVPPDAVEAALPIDASIPRGQPISAEIGGIYPCDAGTWCGTTARAEGRRGGDETDLGCPVSLDEDLWFGLDVDKTHERRAQGTADTCCYQWADLCPGGRPYGEPVVTGSSVAERWLAAAQMEHASVASFARASLELLAAGAPAALIAGCHRAALDELRHARDCLAIARRHAGRALELAPVPALAPRGGALVRVAVDTYLEGCVAETYGALVAVRALEGCADAEASRALRRIARDEARHAELAWQIVAWTIEVGGAPVRSAIAQVRRGLVLPAEGQAADSALAGSGQLDDAALAAAARDAWRQIIAPLTNRVLAA